LWGGWLKGTAMSIILRNTQNKFCKHQKTTTDDFLENHDKIKWGTIEPKNRTVIVEDEKRRNYKSKYN